MTAADQTPHVQRKTAAHAVCRTVVHGPMTRVEVRIILFKQDGEDGEGHVVSLCVGRMACLAVLGWPLRRCKCSGCEEVRAWVRVLVQRTHMEWGVDECSGAVDAMRNAPASSLCRRHLTTLLTCLPFPLLTLPTGTGAQAPRRRCSGRQD